MAAPLARIPTAAAPTTSGVVPHSFENLTRTSDPPALVRTIIRTDWLSKRSVGGSPSKVEAV